MLTGSHGLWRIRIGDYRVVYMVDDQRRIVRVAAAGRRDVWPDLDMPVAGWRLTTWPQTTGLATARLPGGHRSSKGPGSWGSPARRGMSGQLSEIGGGPAVYFGDRVGVVAQGGGGAAAVAEAGGGVAQVDASGQELAGG